MYVYLNIQHYPQEKYIYSFLKNNQKCIIVIYMIILIEVNINYFFIKAELL